MPFQDFEFDLRVDRGARPGMLADAVAAEVARQLGYGSDEATRLVGEINVAVAEICRAGQKCSIRFRADAGELEVLVSAGPHATRRFVHPIP